jgi:hypothetical protein
MPPRIARFVITCLAVLYLTTAGRAEAAQSVRQYEAALTRIFLWRYQALPLFRLNPAFPGDLITLKNETKYASYEVCYPKLKVGNYRGIQDYSEGESIGLSGEVVVDGELLSKKIASVEAQTSAKFSKTGQIVISPLSAEQVDLATLEKFKTGDPNCQIIPDALIGKSKGIVLTQVVLHGKVLILLSAKIEGAADVKAQGELLKLIAKSFSVKDPKVAISGNAESFMVSTSPGNMSLAIVPTGFNFEELARITNFLRGKRGAALELAVQEALTAGDVSLYERAKLVIQDILGSDELRNKERWAENFIGSTPIEKIRDARETIDLKNVANYAAAMELERQEAPTRRQ